MDELKSPWDLSITSHESYCLHETANSKFIISEVMRFVYSDSCKNGMTKQKLLKVQLRSSNITFFRVSRVPERCTGIFKVSNAWTNMRNKMMEEKAWDRVQNSKKRFEKNEYACSSDGSFRTSDPTALPY